MIQIPRSEWAGEELSRLFVNSLINAEAALRNQDADTAHRYIMTALTIMDLFDFSLRTGWQERWAKIDREQTCYKDEVKH